MSRPTQNVLELDDDFVSTKPPSDLPPKPEEYEETEPVEPAPKEPPPQAITTTEKHERQFGRHVMEPYRNWSQRELPDPRTSPANDVMGGLDEIIAAEGPIVCSRLYHLYAKGAGLGRTGRMVRDALDAVIKKAIQQDEFHEEKMRGKKKPESSVIRLADTPEVRIRELGDRGVVEIPLSEVAAVMKGIEEAKLSSGKEGLFRTTLGFYGLARLTKVARSHLENALEIASKMEEPSVNKDIEDHQSHRGDSQSPPTSPNDKLLGEHPDSGVSVFLRVGRFGPYIDTVNDGNKTKRVSVPENFDVEQIDLDLAMALLSLPRTLGIHPDSGKPVKAGIGKYGPYVQHERTFRALDASDNILTIGINRAVHLIESDQPQSSGPVDLGSHPDDGAPVTLRTGRFGQYVEHSGLRASVKPDLIPDLTLEAAIELLRAKALRDGKKIKKKKRTRGGQERHRPIQDTKQESKEFNNRILREKFSGTFTVMTPYRNMHQSSGNLIYFGGYNKLDENWWYRVGEGQWELLRGDPRTGTICFTNAAEHAAYIIPVKDIDKQVKLKEWDRDYLEVNIDYVAHRWRDLDWDIRDYFHRFD